MKKPLSENPQPQSADEMVKEWMAELEKEGRLLPEDPVGTMQVTFHRNKPAFKKFDLPLSVDDESARPKHYWVDKICDWIFKTIAILLGIIIYPLMAIFFIAIPFVFIGAIWQVFANPPSSFENWLSAFLVIAASGVCSFFVYDEVRNSCGRLVNLFTRKE